MPKLTISEDKARILAQLKCNLDNMPDSEAECAALFPQMSGQVRGILRSLYAEDFRPAELQALLSVLGPVMSRTPLVSGKIPHRGLRSVV